MRWRRVASRLSVGLWLCGVLGGATQAWAGEWDCKGNREGSRFLTLAGAIEAGEFDRFNASFKACFPPGYVGQRTIDLFSGGGSVTEALNIADMMIREGSGPRPLAVRVSRGRYCISACTFLFMAGRLRDVALGASFEPHGFSRFLGDRIDVAIQRATDKSGSIQWDKLELQMARLSFLAFWLQPLAEADKRFDFAASWSAELADARGRGNGAIPRLVQGFLAMPAPQREFVQMLDGVLKGAMPEQERAAALKAFVPLLKRWGGQNIDEQPYLEERYFNWVVGEFEAAMKIYLRKIKDNRPPVLGQNFMTSVIVAMRDGAADVEQTVTQQLGPYLDKRSDQIDLTGLTKVMFSTSILYTRPMTREELCDLNVINRDCSD